MNRKETPDIMTTLMEGKKETMLAVEQANKQTSKQVDLPPSLSVRIEESFSVPDNYNDQAVLKEKATFNLSKSVLGELEDVWIDIRKLRGDKKISKADIVDQAIEEAVKEFRAKKEASKFYGNLVSNKTVKQ